MAKLCSELPFHSDRLGQSSLPHALCDGGKLTPIVVQLRASVFNVAAPALNRLDGDQQVGAGAGCLLCGGLLPRQRDLHLFDP